MSDYGMASKDSSPKNAELNDLGFGSRVAERGGRRLLTRDGSFNVVREGLSFFESLHLYHSLLTMSWPRFYLTIGLAYVLINSAFAVVFVITGFSIDGATSVTVYGRFLEAFFFSAQTFTTVGYGRLAPLGVASNIIAALDAFIGLISFAIATGLLFARFSKPSAKILFSRRALISPYKNIRAFEFRMANARSNQLVDVEVKVVLSMHNAAKGKGRKRFQGLRLERPEVTFLPLHLTVVHAIGDDSPLKELTPEDLEKADAEFLVLVKAFDETFSQTVHARTSYKFDEVEWNVKFSDMFCYTSDGIIGVDLGKIHDFEKARP